MAQMEEATALSFPSYGWDVFSCVNKGLFWPE